MIRLLTPRCAPRWLAVAAVASLAAGCGHDPIGGEEATPSTTCSALTLLPGEIYRQDFEEACVDWFSRSSVPIPVLTSSPPGPMRSKAAMVSSQDTAEMGPYYSSWLSPIEVAPGRPYCFGAWALWNADGPILGIRRFGERTVDLGKEHVLIGSPLLPVDPETGPVTPMAEPVAAWAHLRRTVTTPEDTRFVQLFAGMEPSLVPEGGSVMLIDGVSLRRGACEATGEPPVCFPADIARGLRGEYFDDRTLATPRLTRTDGPIAFDWALRAPDPILGPDTFSVRWTGFVVPRHSETYTFRTRSNDGVRLWVNGQPIIDNWTDHSLTENSGAVALEAHKPIEIRLEYYDNTGDAVIQLDWQSPSQAREPIPRSQLLPPGRGECTSSGTLLGHWTMDDGSGITATDATCLGNHGTLREFSAPPAWVTNGQVGGALSFNGSSNWVRVGSSPSLNRIARTNQLTVSAWVKATSLPSSGIAMIASRQVSATPTAEHWALGFRNGAASFYINSHEGGMVRCSAPTAAPVGQRIQIAGTFDGQIMRTYVDGVEACSAVRPVTLQPDTTPLVIGGGANTASDDATEIFNGAIDDVALYDRTLTPGEIASGVENGACVAQAGPPELKLPGIVLAEEVGFSGKAPVTFTASAQDDPSGQSLAPTCTPASGSVFLLGTTVVTCTATGMGGTAEGRFNVQVTPRFRGPRVALFVVGDTALSAGDAAVRGRLEAQGYDVVVKRGSSMTAEDAVDKAVVVISESVEDSDVTTKLNNTRVPAVVMDLAVWRDMRMTGNTFRDDKGFAASQTALDIIEPHHPLAGGLSGQVTVTTTATTLLWGRPSTSAVTVATLPGQPQQYTIFGYETGAMLVPISGQPNITAPARRVGLFPSEAAAALLTAEGITLLDAAIVWATQAEAVLVVANSASLDAGDAALRARLGSLGYGTVVKTDAAVTATDAGSADLVIISESVQPTNVGTKLTGVRVPVMCLEPLLWDELQMTGAALGTDQGEAVGATQIQVVNATHPLAAGLPPGPVSVASVPGRFKWGKPSVAAARVATVPGQPNQYTIFGYPTGTAMVGGTAVARRLGWFADADVPATLTDSGWHLFDAAARWVAQPEILLVVASEPISAADAAVKARLESLGFGAVVKSPAVLAPGDPQGKVAGVVSPSVVSMPAAPDTLAMAAAAASGLPLLVMDAFLFDDLGMCGTTASVHFGVLENQTQLDIIDPAHPMAAELSGRVTTTSAPGRYLWGKPNAAATIVARPVGFADRGVIFGYRAGAQMVSQTARARRAGFFAGGMSPAILSSEGQILLDAAIKWTVSW